ncbi:MAG: sulfite exporter TauE/SafE family protein [Lachnospiraceae bacterium]|nr:sulfite exporter TauE/SafE family protein [Lachnospiraceae bacterium]
MNKHTIFIGIKGIYCEHCVHTITKALRALPDVETVDIRNNVARVSCDAPLEKEILIKTIRDIGYETDAGQISEKRRDVVPHISWVQFILTVLAFVLAAALCRWLLGFDIFTLIPTIDSNITYAMLIVTGALTSLHCVCMCGALNLSASAESNSVKNFKRPLLYNMGRVISYTAVGGIVGTLGSVIHVSTALSGIFVMGAAIFMLLFSLNMLGLVDFYLPHFIRLPMPKGKNFAFTVGLLNGFMPCGPLQSMQLYALATGSGLLGALSMFLFAIGTVPLMLLFGVSSNLLTGKTRARFRNISAVLVLLLSITMANRGLSILGIRATPAVYDQYESYLAATIEGDVQKVSFHLSYSDYADVVLQKGIPVEMDIIVDEGYLTGCNETVISPAFDFQKKLSTGDNIITFTPAETGDYTYSCWMNMIENKIKVIDDKQYFAAVQNST